MNLTENLGLSLNFSGVIRMRQALIDNFKKIDAFMTGSGTAQDNPNPLTEKGASFNVTGAEVSDSRGYAAKEVIYKSTAATGITMTIPNALDGSLPIGMKITIMQAAGVVTVAGSGGVTVTTVGTKAANTLVTVIKTAAGAWSAYYPAANP